MLISKIKTRNYAKPFKIYRWSLSTIEITTPLWQRNSLERNLPIKSLKCSLSNYRGRKIKCRRKYTFCWISRLKKVRLSMLSKLSWRILKIHSRCFIKNWECWRTILHLWRNILQSWKIVWRTQKWGEKMLKSNCRGYRPKYLINNS